MAKNVDSFGVNSINKNSPKGYSFEVDLEYPDELHTFHNDYPLAPEKFAIPCDILSGYCKKIADEYRIKVGVVMKLIPNFGDKTNYVLHYKNLQLYLSLGMKLTKIYKVLNLSTGRKNILILTQNKEQTLLIVSKKILLN